MTEEDDRTQTRYEEFTVSGSELLEKVKSLIHEGNVRRVYIKHSDGRTLLEIPLTAGVAITAVAAAVSPVLVAVGAIAALLTQVTLGVERRVDAEPPAVAEVDPPELEVPPSAGSGAPPADPSPPPVDPSPAP